VPTDLDLIELQFNTLYRCDAAERLLDSNDVGNPPAPRLAIGRTKEGTRWRFRHDLPAALTEELNRLLATEPPPRDLREPPRTLARVLAVLASHAPVTATWSGPAWYYPDPITPPNTLTPIPITDEADLLPTFPGFAGEVAARQPFFAIVDGGAVVAICFSARFAPGAAEAGVNTLAGFRGRGYAAAAVAAWASAVRQTGRLPLYSTSWDNVASQGVARKLGLALYGANLSFS
jgi:RimJ/RimL family protein N-acetyltransferase